MRQGRYNMEGKNGIYLVCRNWIQVIDVYLTEIHHAAVDLAYYIACSSMFRKTLCIFDLILNQCDTVEVEDS